MERGGRGEGEWWSEGERVRESEEAREKGRERERERDLFMFRSGLIASVAAAACAAGEEAALEAAQAVESILLQDEVLPPHLELLARVQDHPVSHGIRFAGYDLWQVKLMWQRNETRERKERLAQAR